MTTFNGFGQQALPFLKALNFHQSREWFKENKGLYESELETPRGDLVEALTEAFAAVPADGSSPPGGPPLREPPWREPVHTPS